jgi:DNA-binding Lrp family transcriptional regulator
VKRDEANRKRNRNIRNIRRKQPPRPETIAKMANISQEETKAIIEKLEKEKVIIDYSAMIDWRKVDGHEGVTAMIDVKVTPKRGVGFDEVAERIYRFQEVESVYLMSGVYDLSVVIRGKRCRTYFAFRVGKIIDA